MSVIYDETRNLFFINTEKTSYVLAVIDGYPIHVYWGKKITQIPENADIKDLFGFFGTADENFPKEYPTFGNIDLRAPAINVQNTDGSTITDLRYVSHKISGGKPLLAPLPATYTENDSEAQTLELSLRDELTGLEVSLYYTAFETFNAITRSAKIKNCGNGAIKLDTVMSASLDIMNDNYDFIHLHGGWAGECNIERMPIIKGQQSVDSRQGKSSHAHNPFFALAEKSATETQGDVYGFNLVYSGNFYAGVYASFGTLRAQIGINPFNSGWILEKGEEFQTPEAVMVYSAYGIGEMSRTYHRLYRLRLCRGKYRDAQRPVLVNNWEATYFDFNENKLIALAKKAKSVGIEMLVLDDGWFGKRNSDNCSLGDWHVNLQKIPSGLYGLAEKLNSIGIKFGLWIEPEMVSPNSELYDKHPDWCLHVPGRRRSEIRNQLVLDLSRSEVRDYIVSCINSILKSAKIEYIKWDMNRSLTEVWSRSLNSERQCELYHRYVLGLYDIMERIISENPDVLFESCSSGGGRFDPGMLYYMPQVWTSDNTDGIDRLYIQHGTSLVYPASSVSAHVSSVPNHQVNRTTSLELRGCCATAGQLGYELDLCLMKKEELEKIKEQITFYKEIRDIVHKGDLYRLKSPFEGNSVVWEYVSENKRRIVLFLFTTFFRKCPGKQNIKLLGIDKNFLYKEKTTDKKYSGEYLENVGLFFEQTSDFEEKIIVLESEKV